MRNVDPSRIHLPWWMAGLTRGEYRVARAFALAVEHPWCLLLGLVSLLAATLLLGVTLALACMTSLPPGSRSPAICLALGTEAPCVTEEIGHIKGYVTALADDGTGRYAGVLYHHGHLYAATLGTTDELTLLARVTDPETNWSDLLLPSTVWPTLRTIAKVTEGVAVLRMARVTPGGTDGTGSAMATTAKLKVRIALVVLH